MLDGTSGFLVLPLKGTKKYYKVVTEISPNSSASTGLLSYAMSEMRGLPGKGGLGSLRRKEAFIHRRGAFRLPKTHQCGLGTLRGMLLQIGGRHGNRTLNLAVTRVQIGRFRQVSHCCRWLKTD